MPELPEVETICSLLRRGTSASPSLLGMRVESARLLWRRTLAMPSPDEFASRLPGQTIQEISRRGKFLVFLLSRDALLIHLRMSGDLQIEPASQPLAPHCRLTLDFQSGVRLAFVDPRKFGRVWLVADPQQVLGSLGPEPFDPMLTPEEFHARLAARRRQLKPLLLDQTFLAGLGNIYSDEALHLARLHPLTRSDWLTLEESRVLLESIRQVLRLGIRLNGASIDWVYRGGDFQNYFRVYRRAGLPCPTCGAPIQRLVVGQRGTHFCPTCQPVKSP